uniref:Uncharacterized protein n=1 Tax=Anguilla anguilla TaxID=7936 RepID=A0A0E9T2M2_ANGAN
MLKKHGHSKNIIRLPCVLIIQITWHIHIKAVDLVDEIVKYFYPVLTVRIRSYEINGSYIWSKPS